MGGYISLNNLKILFLLTSLFVFSAQSQIVIDNTTPYNTPNYLVNNVLLGGGVVVSNQSFIGDSNQIGFFNGIRFFSSESTTL